MTRRSKVVAPLAGLVAGLSRASRAFAQGIPAPGPGTGPYPSADGGGLVAPAIILGLALLGVLILSVAIMDLRRKRRAQAVAIEGQIADALMREPRLTGAVITTLATVPLGGGAPTVEVRGEVEYPELREAAVRIVRQELLRHHSEGRVEDRIFVSPPVPAGRH
jgi:hypothetical protein